MSENPYVELLKRFQEAHAEFGAEAFFLVGFTNEEFTAHRDGIEDVFRYVAYVPLGEYVSGRHTPGYSIYAPVRRNRFMRWTETWTEPFERFYELASLAGASLPLKVREAIPFQPGTPAGLWLGFMWWQNPPSEEDLSPPDPEGNTNRVIWYNPFLDSADRIQRSRLAGYSGQPGSPAPSGGASASEGGEVRGNDRESAGSPPDPIRSAGAARKYCCSRATLLRNLAKGTIKTYRPKNGPRNAKHVFSESELQSVFGLRP